MEESRNSGPALTAGDGMKGWCAHTHDARKSTEHGEPSKLMLLVVTLPLEKLCMALAAVYARSSMYAYSGSVAPLGRVT